METKFFEKLRMTSIYMQGCPPIPTHAKETGGELPEIHL